MKKDSQHRNVKPSQGLNGERQFDLAEGEPDTVEESIRAHERKGDLPGKSVPDENKETD